MSSLTPQTGAQPRRWKLYLSLGILVLGGAAGAVGWIEMQESNFQARYFNELAKTSTWTVEPGANKDIWFPYAGPYEQRLGYA